MELLFKFGTECRNLGCRKSPVGLMVCLLLTGSGCTSGESPVEYPQGGNQTPIVFRSSDPASRATVTTSVRKIGVFGYSHPGDFSPATTTYIPDYFLNKAVIDKTGANWSYDGVVKYWPDADSGVKLSFFAYAPYIDVENTFELKPDRISDQVLPTIKYTVPANITDQIDLLWGNAFNQIYTTNSGVVNFSMNHALTKVNFAIKLADGEIDRPYLVTIKELTLQNLIGGGILNLSKEKDDVGLWSFTHPTTDADLTAYTYTPGTGLVNLTLDAKDAASASESAALFSNGHCLMLIPQKVEDQYNGLTPAQVVIKYTCTNTYSGETDDKEVTLGLTTTTFGKWEAGAGVNYLITLSLLKGTEIEFDIAGVISNTPWQDGNNGTTITGDVN